MRTCPVVGILTPCTLDASPTARIVPFVPKARIYLGESKPVCEQERMSERDAAANQPVSSAADLSVSIIRGFRQRTDPPGPSKLAA